MVLKIPDFESPMGQSDVRETAGVEPTPVIADFTTAQHTHADAAGGGLTTHKSGDGSDHADVATNTADIATINGSFVRTAVAGEGIDVSSATGNVTITCEEATDTNKGIASFDANHFTVTNGDVATNISAGEGIDITAGLAISAEDATSANKGIASFNGDDFSIAAGDVSLKNKTSYASIGPSAFVTADNATSTLTTDDSFGPDGAADVVYGSIQLPHGAIVTGAIVSGDGGGTVWSLIRTSFTDGSSTMATDTIGNEDTTITNATIDNSTYSYMFKIASDNDLIYGARIKYTTDYA